MKPQFYRYLGILAGFLVLLLELPVSAQGPPPPWRGRTPSAQELPPLEPPDKGLIERLNQETGGQVRIAYHHQTGRVRFIGASPERTIPQPAILGVDPTPEEAARGFLATYGQLFGLTGPERELTVLKRRAPGEGRAFVRFQQIFQGVPVVGGELIVQVQHNWDIISAGGEILPKPALETTPTLTAETARQTALAKVAKDYGLTIADLTAGEPELWIYNPILLGGPGRRVDTLVWRTEVTPLDLAPINEFVLIDARLGNVVLQFNQIDSARNRFTYDANNGVTLPGVLVCNEANPTCSGGDSHEVAAHTYAGDTYDFYATHHGRDSIDNAGMSLISTVHYGSSYANAFWNGAQMVYGDGYGFPLADDVVAHELTHGVTDYESSLFYLYQSGAINESFSDIWGEFVDLYQATANDAGDTRWELGEDVSGLGALRNMQDPTLFNDPDRMTSLHYFCQQSQLGNPYGDNGGVHTNSGIGNKAAYLLTDGAAFNGYTVTGLGYARVADLFYEVQTNLLTSAADYADLHDALIQACTNLGYSAGDCQEVQDAVDATEMDQQPTVCAAPEAPVCDAGLPANLFFDDIESGSGNWTAGSNSGAAYWFVPQTTETLGLPGPYATSGVGNIWGFDQGSPVGSRSDTFLAMNGDVTLPANAYLHFNHSFGFESSWSAGLTRYDGGVLEYSVNGGGSWNDAGALMTHNGYNGTISAAYGNPLGGRAAFTADSRGYISSRLDLNSLAGQNVRFRFRIGTDNTIYDYGWFIDDVRIYTCGSGSAYAFPYYDDFESGSPDWTYTNLWHVVQDGVSPYPNSYSPIHSWWYGQDATGNYDTGATNSGSLISPPIELPAGVSPIWLNFWQWYQTESWAGELIYFDRYHDTDGDHIGSGGPYQNLANELWSAGNAIYEYNQPIELATLSGHTVLALFDPEVALSDDELVAIQTFMVNGGRVIVLGEWGDLDGTNTILNVLSQNYGIEFNSDAVYDVAHNDGEPVWPLIANYANHPLTQGLDAAVLYAAASLSVGGGAVPLASGDGDSSVVVLALADMAPVDENGTGLGQKELQAADIVSGAPVVMAYVQVGLGDLIAIGDSGLWSNFNGDGDGNAALYEYDNLALALNMFDRGGPTDVPVYDVKWIQVSVNGGLFQTVARVTGGPLETWHQYWVPMSQYAGSTIQIRFYFNTFDGVLNDYRGWYVDDIVLAQESPAPGTGTRLFYLPIIVKNHP
ncbi:MAG: DUF4350 domain-containing protein [Chloroflexota bacterium]